MFVISFRVFWPTLPIGGIAKESKNLTRNIGIQPAISLPPTHQGRTPAVAAPLATSSPHFPRIRSSQESTSLHRTKGL